jgi:hypothetical protein
VDKLDNWLTREPNDASMTSCDELLVRLAEAIGGQMDDSWDYDRFWKPHKDVFDGAAYAVLAEIERTHRIIPKDSDDHA